MTWTDRDAAPFGQDVWEDLAAAYDGREGVFHRISLVESVTLPPGVPGSGAILRPRRA